MPSRQQFAAAADRRVTVLDRRGGERLDGVRLLPAETLAVAAGERLLAAAALALTERATASVDLELGAGQRLAPVLAIRVAGPVAEVSTRRGSWDIGFRVDAVTGFRVRRFGD